MPPNVSPGDCRALSLNLSRHDFLEMHAQICLCFSVRTRADCHDDSTTARRLRTASNRSANALVNHWNMEHMIVLLNQD
jgi:hypothetical protein